ncbi:hypothetical protein [Arthrobacter antioxidans]|uniref:hypothetical protein n=1 Tax=Arthrobacter antioxidans TaxID=2895818 RepID=UPI0020000292|nr:hypothetical protein [Arthrobacter antioxidans]
MDRALVLALLLVAAIGATSIGVPVAPMVTFWNPWLLVTLIFVATGILLLVRTVAAARTIAWRACHRSSFVLREGWIGTTEWNTMGAEDPVRRMIPMQEVVSVIVSCRILRRVILTGNGGGTSTETAPILHVLFDQDGRRRISSVPFASHEDPAVDTWIEALRKHRIELGYTARPLSWKEEDHLGDEARLEYFATTEEVIDFPDTGGWLENTTRLDHRRHQNLRQVREQAERLDPALRERRLTPGACW